MTFNKIKYKYKTSTDNEQSSWNRIHLLYLLEIYYRGIEERRPTDGGRMGKRGKKKNRRLQY